MGDYKISNRYAKIRGIKAKRPKKDKTPYSPLDEVANIKTRLASKDLDTEKIVDRRNWFEKWTNLPQGQNFLFDAFELLSRPQQALFGGINNLQKGKSVWKGVKEGFSGKKYTPGGKILRNAGIGSNKKGDIIDDIPGLFLDIFADIPLIGPAGKVGKGVKALDKVTDVARVADKVVDTAKLADKAVDAGKATNLLSKLDNLKVMYPDELAFSLAGKGLKKAGGFANNATIKALTKLDAGKGITYKNPLAKRVADLGMEGAENASKVGGKLKAYTSVKNMISDTFNRLGDFSDDIKDAMYKNLSAKGITLNALGPRMKKLIGDTDALTQHLAAKYPQKSAEEINSMIFNVYEYATRDATINFDKIVKSGQELYVDKKTYNNLMGLFNTLAEKGVDIEELTDVVRAKKQLDIIKKSNPMLDDYHVGIRSTKDIKTAKQAFSDPESFTWGDFTKTQADEALKTGKVTVYSSKPIENGTFVSTSRKQALEYAGNNPKKIHKMEVSLNDVAWLNGDEGQFARVPSPDYTNMPINRVAPIKPKPPKKLNVKALTSGKTYKKYITNNELAKYKKLRKEAFQAKRDLVASGKNSKALKKVYAGSGDKKVISGYKVVEKDIKTLTNDQVLKKQAKIQQYLDFKKELQAKAYKRQVDSYNKAMKKYNKDLVRYEKTINAPAPAKKLDDPMFRFEEDIRSSVEGAYKISDIVEVRKLNLKKAKRDIYKIKFKGPAKEFWGRYVEEYPELAKRFIKDIKAPNFYSKEDLRLFKELLGDRKVTEYIADNRNAFSDLMTTINEINNTSYKQSMDSYVRHVATPQAVEFIEKNKPYVEKAFNNAGLKGVNNLEAGRKWNMSAREANDIYTSMIADMATTGKMSQESAKKLLDSGAKLFEEDMLKSTYDFVMKMPSQAATANLDRTLLRSILPDNLKITDVGEIRKAPLHGETPVGFKKVSAPAFGEKLKNLNRFTNDPDIEKLANKLRHSGDGIAIDNRIYAFMGFNAKKTDYNGLAKILGAYDNFYKSAKLLSPTFQINNLFGNISNMYLSGMSLTDIGKYQYKANRILSDGNRIMKLLDEGKELTAADKLIYKKYIELAKSGLIDTSAGLYGLEDIVSGTTKELDTLERKAFGQTKEVAKMQNAILKRYGEMGKDAVKKINDANFRMNDFIDKQSRIGMYLFAQDHPKFLETLGAKTPTQAVRFALFDYSDLSDIEKNYIRKFVPFYTYAKKNLAYQIQNISKNTRQYSKMYRAYRSAWNATGINRNDIDQYKLDNMWIPIPMKNKDGKYLALRTNMPMAELGEFIDDPFRKVMGSTGPIIKAPFELATNKNIYTGQPISEFKGDPSNVFPSMTKKGEYLLSQTGLDVPIRSVKNIFDSVGTVGSGIANKTPVQDVMKDVLVQNRVLSEGDAVKTNLGRQYDLLDGMRQTLKFYKQEGYKIPDMKELETKDPFIKLKREQIRRLLEQEYKMK